MKFRGVCLYTRDVPGLAGFYAKIFGVQPEGDAVHSALNTGEAGLAIYHPDGLEAAQPGPRRFVLMFEVKDVDGEYERLKALGVKLIQPPTTQPWGNRALAFLDPEGNQVNLFTPVAR